MENISTIKDRILTFLEFKGIKKADFYSMTGISDSNFKGKNLTSQLGGDSIVKVLTSYPNLSADWLLTGEGSMIKSDLNGIQTTDESIPSALPTPSASPTNPTRRKEAVPLAEIKTNYKAKPIPLVTEKAAAGFGSGYFSIAEKDVKEYYVVPKFRSCHVDFMIEVSGLSMYPHYNPGDVIACTILNDRKFLQWNKCHVIATREQGIIVKRLMPSKREGYLTAVSDNKDYPPFDIPVEEITGIALVVGSVSLE